MPNLDGALQLNGYWCFYPPFGYKHIKDENNGSGGKILDFDSPKHLIVKEGLELFANGILLNKEQVKKFFNDKGLISRNNKKIYSTFIDRILNQSAIYLYSGIINYPKWDILKVEAKHPALIDIITANKIFDKLNPKKTNVVYSQSNISEELPLRGYLVCKHCGNILTGGPTRNKLGNYYFYYSCKGKGCEYYRKSYNNTIVHNQFISTLDKLSIGINILDLLFDVVSDVWKEKGKMVESLENTNQKLINQIDMEINKLQERILKTDNEILIKTYEDKIINLTQQKAELGYEIEIKNDHSSINLNSIYTNTKSLLSNPASILDFGKINVRQLMLGVIFGGKIFINKKSEIQIPVISLIYGDLSTISKSNLGDLGLSVLKSNTHIYIQELIKLNQISEYIKFHYL